MIPLRHLLVSWTLGAVAVLALQHPFTSYSSNDDDYNTKDNQWQPEWPVRRVAVIGNGPSGMIAYRELTQAGFNVHVYERDNVAGGNWHYTDETPVHAPVPNSPIEVGDYTPSLPPPGVQFPYVEEYTGDLSERRRDHRGPKPVWRTLTSNAPAPWQQITELPWPEGTSWVLPHWRLQKYMRSFASYHGINSNDDSPDVSYNTRVELVVRKPSGGWQLTLKKLEFISEKKQRATWWTEDFDAVVVATGRFTSPNIPNIPGLDQWHERYPDLITHSRQYRVPEPFSNQTVLIVGAATSGGEISRDINPYAKQVYQSIRPDRAKVPHFALSNFLSRLPANTTIVGEIEKFHPLDAHAPLNSGKIELKNGTIITGIDHLIFSTGFRYSFPFIPQYHNESLGANDTIPISSNISQPIVTDGSHLRSLYLDLFYIEEPTLGFLDMNLGMQTFIYAEYLSVALAKVWDNKAKLPNKENMWGLYHQHVEDLGGYSRHLQFLGTKRNDDMIKFFIGWLNDAAVKYGGRQLDGPPKISKEVLTLWSAARFARGNFHDGSIDKPDGNDTSFKIAAMNGSDDLHFTQPLSDDDAYNMAFGDFW